MSKTDHRSSWRLSCIDIFLRTLTVYFLMRERKYLVPSVSKVGMYTGAGTLQVKVIARTVCVRIKR